MYILYTAVIASQYELTLFITINVYEYDEYVAVFCTTAPAEQSGDDFLESVLPF